MPSASRPMTTHKPAALTKSSLLGLSVVMRSLQLPWFITNQGETQSRLCFVSPGARLKVGLATLLTLSSATYAQSSDTPAQSDSDGIRASYSGCLKVADGVTPDMQDCIGNEYAYQDKRLNQAYKALMARLGKDEQAKLRDEERKWIAHRDADCAPPPDAGQGQRLDSNDCAMEETAKRATVLEARQLTN